MTILDADEPRLTLDQGLKEAVLQPLSEKFGVDMKDLVFLCVSAAVQAELKPFQPIKKDPNNWHASPSEDIYLFLALALPTDTPIRAAAQLANAVLAELSEAASDMAGIEDLLTFFKQMAEPKKPKRIKLAANAYSQKPQ